MAMRVELAAVVPVYNEAGALARTCRRLARLALIRQIVLVDDGSDDGSTEIVRRLARRPLFCAAYHRNNRGKGAALRTGLKLVRQHFMIIQDADAEYDPADIPALTAALDDEAQVVFGSRMLGARRFGMRPANYLANRVLTSLFNRFYGGGLSDLETGYKLCPTNLLRSLELESDGFEMDPEISAKLLRSGKTITEVPISYHGRSVHDGKKIRPVDALRAAGALWRYRHWTPPRRTTIPDRAMSAVVSP